MLCYFRIIAGHFQEFVILGNGIERNLSFYFKQRHVIFDHGCLVEKRVKILGQCHLSKHSMQPWL